MKFKIIVFILKLFWYKQITKEDALNHIDSLSKWISERNDLIKSLKKKIKKLESQEENFIISKQKEEINRLKANITALKISKDKYKNRYNLLIKTKEEPVD